MALASRGKEVALVALIALAGMGCAAELVPERDVSVAIPEIAESFAIEQPAVRFVDVTAAAGLDFVHTSGSAEQRYILEAMGSGSAFFDFDADGWLDFFAVNGTRLQDPSATGDRLWRNVAGDTGERVFADVTQAAGFARVDWGMGAAVADYDNDGDLDLYVTYWGPNVLYRNEGDGTFVMAESGVEDRRWGTSAAFGDVDADGWQDLYAVNYVAFDLNDPPSNGELCSGWKGLTVFCGPHGLEGQADVLYRNEGIAQANGRHAGFVDMSAATGIDRWAYLGLGVLFTDYDQDGDQDLYIANDSTPNQLYRNDGDWRLQEIGAVAGVAYSEEGRVQAGMGLDVGDYDNDGDADLFVTNFSDDSNTLYQNQGDGSFADATHMAGLGGMVRPFLGWSTALADFDLDGWLDLFVANGHLYPQLEAHPLGLSYKQRNLLYWNRVGVFAPATTLGLEAEQVSRGTVFGDYDNDGDLDLVVNNLNDRPSLLRNDGGNRNNWLGLDLVAAEGRGAVGAQIKLVMGERQLLRSAKRGYGYLSSSDGRVLFGLGDSTIVDKVEVRWPSGRVEVVKRPQIGRYLIMREGLGAEVAHYNNSAPTPGLVVAAARQAPLPAPVAMTALREDWTAEIYHQRATALYNQGRYREVLALLRPALVRYPHETRLHYTAGIALYSGLGQYEEAAELLQAVVARDSAVVEVVRLLGVVYLHLNRPEQAVQALQRASMLAPDHWQTHYRLGLAHNRLGASEQAIAAFERALVLAPDEPMPYLHLAQTYQRLGQGSSADEALRHFAALQPRKEEIDRYRQAIRSNPGDPGAHAKLGLALAQDGRLQEAQTALERSLVLEPAAAAVRTNLANMLLRQGALEAAMEHYRQVLAEDGGLAAAHYGLGMAHHARGEPDSALAALARALALRPNFPKAHINMGVLLEQQQRPSEALEHFQRAVELVPEDVEANNNLVVALARAGRVDAARQALDRALARRVNLPLARKNLVRMLLALAQNLAAQGQLTEAIARQQQAVELTPAKLQQPLLQQLEIYQSSKR